MRADGSRFPWKSTPALLRQGRSRLHRRRGPRPQCPRRAELRYRELMEPWTSIIVRDANGDITHANAAAMRILELDTRLGLEEPWQGRMADPRRGQPEVPGTAARDLERNAPGIASTAPCSASTTGAGFLKGLVVGHLRAAVPGQVPTSPIRCCRVQRRDRAKPRQPPVRPRPGPRPHRRLEWESGSDRLYLTDEAARILGRGGDAGDHARHAAALRELPTAALRGRCSRPRVRRRLRHRAAWQPIGATAAPSGSARNRRGEFQAAGTNMTGTLQGTSPERKQDEETLRVQGAPTRSPACSIATRCSAARRCAWATHLEPGRGAVHRPRPVQGR